MGKILGAGPKFEQKHIRKTMPGWSFEVPVSFNQSHLISRTHKVMQPLLLELRDTHCTASVYVIRFALAELAFSRWRIRGNTPPALRMLISAPVSIADIASNVVSPPSARLIVTRTGLRGEIDKGSASIKTVASAVRERL